jgi:hypothetical protein
MLGFIFCATSPIVTTPPGLESRRNKLPAKCPSTRSTTAILRHRALILCNEARYDEFIRLHKGEDFGDALVLPMNAIEREFEPVQPTDACAMPESNSSRVPKPQTCGTGLRPFLSACNSSLASGVMSPSFWNTRYDSIWNNKAGSNLTFYCCVGPG